MLIPKQNRKLIYEALFKGRLQCTMNRIAVVVLVQEECFDRGR